MDTKDQYYNRMNQGGTYTVDSNGDVHVLTTVSINPDNSEVVETIVHEYNIFTRSYGYPSVSRPLTRV